MKKIHGTIWGIFGIIFFLTLLLSPIVSAQPAMQYLNILGTSFQHKKTVQNFNSGGGCIWGTGGLGGFAFPVLLPRGSIIKFVEFFYYDTVGISIQNLALLKYDPFADPSTSTNLVSLGPNVFTGKAKRISNELNITVETDCMVDSQCFYSLEWGTLANNDTTRLCGARIHYIPPFGALALPIIQRN